MERFVKRFLLVTVIGGVALWHFAPDVFYEIKNKLFDVAKEVTESNSSPKNLTKEEKLDYASTVLEKYTSMQQQLLEEEIIPIICQQLSDKIAEDFEYIIAEYDDKWKIKDNYPDFYTAWHHHFDFYYYKMIVDENLTAYNATLAQFYADFCNKIGTRTPYVSYPQCFVAFEIPKGDINNYIDKKNEDFYWNMADYAVDGVLILSEFVSGGATTPLLVAKFAKTGYDVASTVDQLFFEDAMEDNEKLFVAVSESLFITMENYLKEKYSDCMNNAANQIYKNIKSE